MLLTPDEKEMFARLAGFGQFKTWIEKDRNRIIGLMKHANAENMFRLQGQLQLIDDLREALTLK